MVPPLLLANLFFGIYFNLSVWYKLTDRTYYGTWMTIGGAMITIVLNYLLIPVYGFHGSAVVTLVVYILMVITSYALSKKYYPIPYQLTRGTFYIVITVVVVFTTNTISLESQWLATAFHMLLLFLFILVVWRLEKVQLPLKTS